MQRFLRSRHRLKEGVPWMSFISRSSSCSGCCWSAWRWAAQSLEGLRNDMAVCTGQRGVGRPAGLPRGRAAATGEILVTAHGWILLAAYSVLLLLLAIPTGRYIANVMEGRLRFAGRIENVFYRLCGVKADAEMGWLQYALAIVLFNALGALVVYALQRLQLWLPLNPQGMANVSPDSSFNTALSFVTNTNWQGYVGEATMSYLTQMLGLAVQNFFSAARPSIWVR